MVGVVAGMAPHRTLAGSSARRLGAYYTPRLAASLMARWALRSGSERVLEPSMGEGEFLRAVQIETERAGYVGVRTWGVELALDTYQATVQDGLVDPERAILSDFLAVKPFPVDVAIGNPPYVRLRHLPKEDAARAAESARQALGTPMDPSGSLWMAFVLHATEFLEAGGRLAFVLPYEMTHVRYARPVWQYLSQRFGSLRVVRVHERVFPDILQDVVLLFADDRGGSTAEVEFEAYEHRRDLDGGEPQRRARVAIDRIVAGERPFVEALLPAGLAELLRGKVASATRPVREVAALNIGYVTGDKRFFHPTASIVSEHRLPSQSLVPTVTSSRRITGRGLWTAKLPDAATDRLFLPAADDNALTIGERAYISSGRRAGVHERYKCRIRDPWYVTPGVKVPDLLVPVFADRPLLLVNDGGYAASNSLLCGYLKAGTAEAIAAAWYTSLTLLQVELHVHSLGGGVMVFVPREAGAIRLATAVTEVDELRVVDQRLREGNVDAAYQAGDDAVLCRRLGLTSQEVDLIRAGVESLRFWRAAPPRNVPAG